MSKYLERLEGEQEYGQKYLYIKIFLIIKNKIKQTLSTLKTHFSGKGLVFLYTILMLWEDNDKRSI